MVSTISITPILQQQTIARTRIPVNRYRVYLWDKGRSLRLCAHLLFSRYFPAAFSRSWRALLFVRPARALTRVCKVPSATREKSNNAPFHAATQSAVCRYIDCAIVQGDELSANATMDTFSEIFRGLRGGTNERTKNTARARVSAKFHASLMKKSATSGQKMPPQKCEKKKMLESGEAEKRLV